MRLFIALELADALREHLSRLQSLLRPVFSAASWVRPENLHLTLKFLGQVPDGDVPALCTTLERLAPTPPLRLTASAAECFPAQGRVRVVGIGLAGDIDPLLQLQSAIDAACHSCGHPLESRRFTPHITLARGRTPLPAAIRSEIDRAVRQLGPPPVMHVTEFVLVQSQPGPQGSRYSAAARFPLAGKCA